MAIYGIACTSRPFFWDIQDDNIFNAGGVERLMESDSIIMFHSPYLPDLNAQGDRIANCDIGSETTARLLEYYQEMTSPEQGERLMNRTMSYCSAEDGWVLRGSAAAELFGVATQI